MNAIIQSFSSTRTPRAWRFPHRKSRIEIARTTGPFAGLDFAAPTLVMADAENLIYGARDLGRRVDFAMLGGLLNGVFQRLELHACYSAPADRSHDLFEGTGWTTHRRSIIESRFITVSGANADVSLAFHTAALMAKLQPHTLILASGDGLLGLDIARAAKAQFPACKTVATASLAGSTSHLIDARVEKGITQNIEIGLDVMVPLHHEAVS